MIFPPLVTVFKVTTNGKSLLPLSRGNLFPLVNSWRPFSVKNFVAERIGTDGSTRHETCAGGFIFDEYSGSVEMTLPTFLSRRQRTIDVGQEICSGYRASILEVQANSPFLSFLSFPGRCNVFGYGTVRFT